MNEYIIWLAVNKSGGYRIFKQKPRRDTTTDTWCGDYDGEAMIILAHMEVKGFKLPSLTWQDVPVKLKLSLTYEIQ